MKTVTNPEDEEEEGFYWLTGFGVMVVTGLLCGGGVVEMMVTV